MNKSRQDFTAEEKYNYLLSRMKVTDVCLWEKDVLLQMSSIFYQFNVHPAERTFDEIIEAEMNKKLAK